MKKLKKAFAITDAKISFVSLVDAAANKHKFLITKQEDGKAGITTYGKIIKADAESHYVTGIVYEPMVEDTDGNFMTEEEIIKAAYWFAKNGDKVDLQHNFEPLSGATVVETWVAKADFEIEDTAVKKGTWLITVEITDDSVWKDIHDGKITGFSMGGVGQFSEEDTDLDNANKSKNTSEKKGLLKQIASAFGLKLIDKGVVAEIYDSREKCSRFWSATSALENTLYHTDNSSGERVFETDRVKIMQALEDFNRIITDLLIPKDEGLEENDSVDNSPVEKAGRVLSQKRENELKELYETLGEFLSSLNKPETDGENKEEVNVTKEEVQQIVNETVSAAIEKARKSEPTALTAEQVQNMISDSIEKAIDPILKSTGVPSNLNNSGNVQPAVHYLHGII